MNEHDLIDIIGEADERQVQRAGEKKRRRRTGWAVGLAACFMLAAGAGFLLSNTGGSAGGGGDGDLRYMNYAGPVLPLTALGDTADITAERHIDFDFSPYIPVEDEYETSTGEIETRMRHYSQAKVTDSYVLRNDGTEDRTLTLLYPFSGTLGETEYHPSLTVDGETVETAFYAGPYAGGYMGALGASREEVENGSVNLDLPECYEDYERLLSDGCYLASAMDEFPVLDQPVAVYRLSDYVVEVSEEATNPTLQMRFYIDPDKTDVLTWHINGGHWNHETGFCGYSTSDIERRPNASPENREPEDSYIIVLGEDITDYTLQGYRDGGCDEGEEEDGISCTVTRYETTLGEILRELTLEHYDELWMGEETFLGLAAELLTMNGPLAENGVDRYDEGMLDSIVGEVRIHKRVMYFAFDVTVPAGGSVTVEALTVKDESMDYIGDDKGKDGYDMATTLGTSLSFTEQTASLSNGDNIEIVAQNFGFDLAGGVTEVTLDQSVPHYWLEIKVKK